MSRGHKEAYLKLLQRYHDGLVVSSSLAAPSYATAIHSLTLCPVPQYTVDGLDDLEGFSPGIRRKLTQLIEDQGGIEAVDRQIAKDRQQRRGRQSWTQSIDEWDAELREQNATLYEQVDDDAGPSTATGHRSSASDSTKRSRARKDGSAGRPNTVSVARDTSRTSSTSNGRSTSASASACTSNAASSYLPPAKSGGWGILVALYLLSRDCNTTEESASLEFTKDEIISVAKKYCKSSYTYQFASRPNAASNQAPGRTAPKFVTAWSTMKTLLNKGLVWQRGRPAKYTLSEVGSRSARRAAKEAGQARSDDEDCSSEEEHVDEAEEAAITGETSIQQRDTRSLLDHIDMQLTSRGPSEAARRPASSNKASVSRKPNRQPTKKSRPAHNGSEDSDDANDGIDFSASSDFESDILVTRPKQHRTPHSAAQHSRSDEQPSARRSPTAQFATTLKLPSKTVTLRLPPKATTCSTSVGMRALHSARQDVIVIDDSD